MIKLIKFNHLNLSIDNRNKHFEQYNIETRPFFYPIYKHNHLTFFKSSLSSDEIYKSEILNQNIIMLPSYPLLINETDNFNRIIHSIYQLYP